MLLLGAPSLGGEVVAGTRLPVLPSGRPCSNPNSRDCASRLVRSAEVRATSLGDRRVLRSRGARFGVGAGVRLARTSGAREESLNCVGLRGAGSCFCFGFAFAIGWGAGARSGSPRIQPGVFTTPVATQRAPAPAPETQKPMIVAIVAIRPPPVCVAM